MLIHVAVTLQGITVEQATAIVAEAMMPTADRVLALEESYR